VTGKDTAVVDTTQNSKGLDAFRTAEGGFAMLALDQRESLREMFPIAEGADLPDDDVLREFKRVAAGVLTPFATGVLLDRPLGVSTPHRPDWIAEGCGLLLAADVLHSVRGVGVLSTSLDEQVTPELIEGSGAAAIKLLIIWRRDSTEHQQVVADFLAVAEAAGVASFVEGIVRPPVDGAWVDAADRHAAIIEAARELSVGASVYKAEVPGYVPGDVSLVTEQSRLLTSAIDVPWVVLSNGVRAEDFGDAVTAACAGGASGFLAGRAIWADTVGLPDQKDALEKMSVPRLRSFSTIVRESRQSAISRLEG